MTEAAFPKPIGTMPTLTFLLLDQLEIDEAYQRSIDTPGSQSMIRQIARGWNWDLCQPLFVARREDGRMFVVDGQHCLAAARLRGDIAQLPCIVSFTNGVTQEARLFSEFNRRRRPPSPLDLYFSDLAAGDDIAHGIAAALKDAGMRMARHGTTPAYKPGEIGNIGGLRRCLQLHGQDVLTAALQAASKGWPGHRLNQFGTIFPGIAEIMRHERALARKAQGWALNARVQAVAPFLGRKQHTDWNALILRRKGEQPGTNLAVVAAEVMLAHWTKANP